MKSFALTILILFYAFQVNADPSITKIKNPFFFSATKDNKQWWILGTSHLGINVNELPDYVLKIFSNSQTAVFETLPSSDSSFHSLSYVKPDEKPLDSTTIQMLLNRGISKQKIETTSPGILCIMYVLGPKILQNRMDDSLFEMAKNFNKKLNALDEAAQVQPVVSKIFDSCDLDSIVKNTSPSEWDKENESSLEMYRSGDFSKITKPKESDYELTYKTRNLTWIKKLNSLDEPNAFISVGIGHLDGEYGLLRLLEKQGFIVTRTKL